MALPSVKLSRAVLYCPEDISVLEMTGFLCVKAAGRNDLDIANNYQEFLSETALLSKMIVDCDLLRHFFQSERICAVDFFNLLQHNDFFIQHPNHTVTKRIIEYHAKYGIPIWTYATKHKFVVEETELPQEWTTPPTRAKLLDWIRNPDCLPRSLEKELTEVLTKIGEAGVYPLVVSLPFFIDFYHHFIAEDSNNDIVLGERSALGIHIRAQLTLLEDHSRVINLEAYELENAAYAAAITLMMDNGGLRFCKCCGKMFVADRPRSEYCSPRCRNIYNTRMSRLRKKLRETDSEE